MFCSTFDEYIIIDISGGNDHYLPLVLQNDKAMTKNPFVGGGRDKI